jgi:hypothetical protein
LLEAEQSPTRMTLRHLRSLTVVLGSATLAGCANPLPPPVVLVTPAEGTPAQRPVPVAPATNAVTPVAKHESIPAGDRGPVRIEVIGKDIVLGGKVVDTMPDNLSRYGSLVLSEFALARTTDPATRAQSPSFEPFELVIRDDTSVSAVSVVTEGLGIALPKVRLQGATEVEYQAYSTDEAPSQGGRYLSLDVQRDKVSVFWLKASGKPAAKATKLRFQAFAGLDALSRAARAISSDCMRGGACEPVVIQTEAETPFASLVPLIHAAQVGCAKGQWITARVKPIFNRNIAESAAAASHPRQGGFLPLALIQKVVRQNYGRFRMCHEEGLSRGALEGRVTIRFTIGRGGVVSDVQDSGSDIPDGQTVACVAAAYRGMVFPKPIGGIVTVIYPIMFSPGG